MIRYIFTFLLLTAAAGANKPSCSESEKDPRGKVVIVTGAAQGIGYAIANNFLKQKAKLIIIIDIQKRKGARAAKELNDIHGDGKAVFIHGDVRKNLDQVAEHIFETYGPVDVLVNDAGMLDEDMPRAMITTNTVALIEWSLKLWRHMRKDQDGCGGTIINISSMLGYIIQPFLASYTASKYAVIGFTKSLGHKYNYQNTCVRIVALCPGFTYTAMTDQQMVWDEHLEDFIRLRQSQPWQTADDVGRGAVEVFRNAETGTAWTIIGGNPPIEAPLSLTFTLEDIEALQYSTPQVEQRYYNHYI